MRGIAGEKSPRNGTAGHISRVPVSRAAATSASHASASALSTLTSATTRKTHRPVYSSSARVTRRCAFARPRALCAPRFVIASPPPISGEPAGLRQQTPRHFRSIANLAHP